MSNDQQGRDQRRLAQGAAFRENEIGETVLPSLTARFRDTPQSSARMQSRLGDGRPDHAAGLSQRRGWHCRLPEFTATVVNGTPPTSFASDRWRPPHDQWATAQVDLSNGGRCVLVQFVASS
jgi:hypothetical protein